MSSLFAKLMEGVVTEDDRAMASEFCNSIGCTIVHHLRDELPAFVATIRLREIERGSVRVARLEDLLRATQESTRDTCGSVAKALGYEGPEDGDALVAKAVEVVRERDELRAKSRDVENAAAYGLPTTMRAALEEVHEWREASEVLGYVTPDGLRKNIVALQSALRAMLESTRDTCGSVAKVLGYDGPESGDALVAKANEVVQELTATKARLVSLQNLTVAGLEKAQSEVDRARSEAKVWHESSDRWERAALDGRRDVNLALDEKRALDDQLRAVRSAAARALAHRKKAEADGAARIAYDHCAVEYLDHLLAALKEES